MRGSLRRREIFVRVQGKDDATCIPLQRSRFTLKTVFFLKQPFTQNITLLWFSTEKKWLHSHRCLAGQKNVWGTWIKRSMKQNAAGRPLFCLWVGKIYHKILHLNCVITHHSLKDRWTFAHLPHHDYSLSSFITTLDCR